MSGDALHVNLSVLSLDAASASADPAQRIGLSEIGPYLQSLYGPDIPRTKQARRAGGRLLVGLSALSMSNADLAPLIHERRLDEWLARWMNLMEPLVNNTLMAGGYIDQELTEGEKHDAGPNPVADGDFLYAYIPLQIASVFTAIELGMEPAKPPRRARVTLPGSEKNAAIIREKAAERQQVLDMFQTSFRVSPEESQRLKELRRRGGRVVSDAEAFMPRILALLERPAGPQPAE